MTDRRIAPFFRPAVLGALGVLLAAPSAHAATLSAEAAAAFEVEPFVEGLGQPTDIAILPDGRAIIIERSGAITTKLPGDPKTIPDRIDVDTRRDEQGLLGVVADPAFATNHYVYFYASSGPDDNNRHQILRYEFGADSKLGTKTVVVSMGLKGPANHNGGGIDIYKGNLYMGVGDTGANSTPPSNHFGSCLNQANGKVLRVSLDDATLGQPPADNPLVGSAMVTGCDSPGGDFKMTAPEKRIWAWGFRNPFRLWIDKTTGKVWVGDVGEAQREEITVATAGKHYGYPFWEGKKDWKQDAKECMGITPPGECVAPVYDYDRTDVKGCVIGGRILDGCDWPAAWKSRYIFGDYEMGKVWTVDVNATRDGVVDNSRKEFANASGLAGIRMGTDNALYLMEAQSGTVSRITAKGSTTTPNACPSVNAEPGGNPGGAPAGGAAAGGAAGTNSAGGAGTSSAGTSSAGTTSAGGAVPGGQSGSGSGGSAPGAGGKATSSTDSGGCGCEVAGGGPNTLLFGLGTLVGALGLALARRRVRGS